MVIIGSKYQLSRHQFRLELLRKQNEIRVKHLFYLSSHSSEPDLYSSYPNNPVLQDDKSKAFDYQFYIAEKIRKRIIGLQKIN